MTNKLLLNGQVWNKGDIMGWWKETIDIVKEKDPAARTALEVLLTYPGVKALAAHCLSDFLWPHHCKLRFIQVLKLQKASLLITVQV